MATSVKNTTMTANSEQITNSIIKSTGMNVPLIGENGTTYREVGSLITGDTVNANIFLSALMNRIGKVIINSKLYNNPWVRFKKGLLEHGETIEELYVNMVKGKLTNWASDEDVDPFARTIPDVKSAFHPLNLKSYYAQTVTIAELRTAFLSSEGVSDLVGKIVNTMYTSANLDEFMLMKYVLAKAILAGKVKSVDIPPVTTENMKKIITKVKGTANKMTFMSKAFNSQEVQNFCDLEDQHVLVQADFDAEMSVEVLATAFNMSQADFMGHRSLIDNFGEIDNERMSAIIEGYTPLTSAEIEKLNAIPCVLIDKDFFQIYDVLTEFSEQYNPKKLYWNYFLNVWKVASYSPFMNSVAFEVTE